MREIKEIRKQKESAIVRKLYDTGISLQKVEIFMIAKLAADIFEEALIEVATQIPRVPGTLNRLFSHGDKSIDGRHIVDGKWRRITQIYTKDEVLYYTDGKKEKVND